MAQGRRWAVLMIPQSNHRRPHCGMPGFVRPHCSRLLQPSCLEFRLLDALLDLLARMVPAIGKGSKRELFISSVFNAKAMRNAFPTARRQELQRILNSAKPDTWEDVSIGCTTLVLSMLTSISRARKSSNCLGKTTLLGTSVTYMIRLEP